MGETTHQGLIEAIFGPMFSGKTEELIRRLSTAIHGRLEVLVFRPRKDGRSAAGCLESHSRIRLEATEIDSPREILALVKPDTDAVGIDEVQFFDAGELADVCGILAKRGIRVIVAGLDLDYRGVAFEWFALVASQAEVVTKLTAYCGICGRVAVYTAKLGGSDQRIESGGEKLYDPRCRICFRP